MVLRVGLIGLGTVGTGAVRTLMDNREHINRSAGTEVRLSAIADVDWQRDRGLDLAGVKQSCDGWELIQDPEIDVIVELVGGTGIAKDFVTGALEHGKDVVTANKALLAYSGHELFKKANDTGRKIFFEAAVGGGIPIIQSLYGGLASARISEIQGIINGTSNFILTQMEEKGASFEPVLKEAQDLGYAELDPTFDIEGHDAAHKLALLASICFNTQVNFDDIYMEGIKHITVEDIHFGQRLGYRLKLLAIAKDLGSEVEVRVHPTFIPESSILSAVRGVFNAIETYAEGLGTTVQYGRGAGDRPTGHAVISDVIQCARDSLARQPVSYSNFFTLNKTVRPISEIVAEYYLEFKVIDQPGVMSKITGILGEHSISLLSVLQTETGQKQVPIVIMTHEAREGDVDHALQQIEGFDFVMEKPKRIRIEKMESNG